MTFFRQSNTDWLGSFDLNLKITAYSLRVLESVTRQVKYGVCSRRELQLIAYLENYGLNFESTPIFLFGLFLPLFMFFYLTNEVRKKMFQFFPLQFELNYQSNYIIYFGAEREEDMRLVDFLLGYTVLTTTT